MSDTSETASGSMCLILEVLLGREPELTYGWTKVEPYGRDSALSTTYHTFAHPDPQVVKKAQDIERNLSRGEDFPPNINLNYLHIPRR